MVAIPLVLISLIDYLDICLMVYDSNYVLASATIAWETMNPNELELVSSIPQVDWIPYFFYYKKIDVFSQRERIRVAG